MTIDTPVRLRSRPQPSDASSQPSSRPSIRLDWKRPADLKTASRRPRRHTRAKRALLRRSHERHGDLGAIVATEDGEVLDGHERLEAYRELGRELIPVLVVPNRSAAAMTAARLVLNRAHEVGVNWDKLTLAHDFREVLASDPTLIAATGFTMAEVDGALFQAIAPPAETRTHEPRVSVTRAGDLWKVGRHLVLCGSARHRKSYVRLLGSDRANMILSDPPFGVSVRSISGKHEEFVEGSGMSEIEQRALFEESVEALSGYLEDGAIVDLFIDGRSLALLLTVLKRAGFELKAVCVWDKGAGGMGSLYRHQVEFIIVSKWGQAAHTNNVQLGKYKRNRTTLWSSPGRAQFGSGRAEAIDLHPTVKPIGLLADALLDTSNPGEIILDPFCGTGSTLLACERTGRVGRGIELDPKHVDTSLRRLEQETGSEAVHVGTGLTFAETGRAREAGAGPSGDAVGPEDRS